MNLFNDHIETMQREKLRRGTKPPFFFIDEASDVDDEVFEVFASRIKRRSWFERIFFFWKKKKDPWQTYSTFTDVKIGVDFSKDQVDKSIALLHKMKEGQTFVEEITSLRCGDLERLMDALGIETMTEAKAMCTYGMRIFVDDLMPKNRVVACDRHGKVLQVFSI